MRLYELFWCLYCSVTGNPMNSFMLMDGTQLIVFLNHATCPLFQGRTVFSLFLLNSVFMWLQMYSF